MKFDQDLCLNLQYDFGKMNSTLGVLCLWQCFCVFLFQDLNSHLFKLVNSILSFSGSHISSNWNVFENNPSVLSALDSRKEALIFYDCCRILLPPTFNIFLEVHDIFISHDCRRILLPHTFNIFQRFMIRTAMVRMLWY